MYVLVNEKGMELREMHPIRKQYRAYNLVVIFIFNWL